MLNIKHPEADRLARTLANYLHSSITEVVVEALREKWLREQGKQTPNDLKNDLLTIANRCANLPDHDSRLADDILSYDQYGLPT